jgi:hypothetical protein
MGTDIRLLAVSQLVGLGEIGHVGRRTDHVGFSFIEAVAIAQTVAVSHVKSPVSALGLVSIEPRAACPLLADEWQILYSPENRY